MTREQAIAALLPLTHSWRAVAPTAAEQVAEARRMIGLALLADQAEPLIHDQGSPASADHDPTALSQIELAVAEAVWIFAQAFAVAAPAAYVGLRILGGDLSVDGPAHSSGPIRRDQANIVGTIDMPATVSGKALQNADRSGTELISPLCPVPEIC